MQISDQKFISYALNLARRNLGATAPNPVVGCVIVKNNSIIATGVTAQKGRPHAEQIAIAKIADKNDLIGAEIFVTLEPCAHFGQTEPCADLIIAHQFKRVVIATTDPDTRVNGKGLTKIQEAGIEVICGVMEKEARELNRGFFKARNEGIPFVTLKIATSLDGKIATKNFASKWITSETARQFSHLLRAKNDAIIVGANTLRQDNPSLDCRISGLEDFSPQPIIISNQKEFSADLKIFHNHKKPPLILNGDVKNILEKICQAGFNSVLIEGGQNIATQFLKADLIDEIVWIRSKKIIGNDGIAAIGDLGFTSIAEVLNQFSRKDVRQLEEEIIETYRRN